VGKINIGKNRMENRFHMLLVFFGFHANGLHHLHPKGNDPEKFKLTLRNRFGEVKGKNQNKHTEKLTDILIL